MAVIRESLKRILYLTGELGVGGSESQLRLLLENLNLREWDPRVIVYHPDPHRDHSSVLEDLGIEVIAMSRGRGSPAAKIGFTIRAALRIRPHVVHSWSVHDNPYAAVAGRFGQSRIIWGSLRGSMALPGFRSLPSWYRSLALRSVQKLVVNSQSLFEELQAIGFPDERVVLIPNCVDPRPKGAGCSGSSDLEALGFSAEHHVFGSVANIRRVKNQIVFVRALAAVIERHPDSRGVIVGAVLPGEEATATELVQEIDRLGLNGKCVLAGYRPEARRLISGLAVLCLTSKSEGMPNVVLEAMAARVPVVAAAVGGVPEVVIDGTTGILVQPDDASAFAEGMARVLESSERGRAGCARARTISSPESETVL